MKRGIDKMVRSVDIAQYVISDDKDDILIAPNLGPCIGVVIYSPKYHIYSLGVIPLPDSSIGMANPNVMSYMDKGIPFLVEQIQYKTGCFKKDIIINVYGGSLIGDYEFDEYDVAHRNLKACLKVITNLGLNFNIIESGGKINRTVTINIETGEIKSRFCNHKS